MPKKGATHISSGKCSYCGMEYSLPAGSMDKALAALRAAGWIQATKDGVTKHACPKDQCHSDLRGWWEGVQQGNLEFPDNDENDDADADAVDEDLSLDDDRETETADATT